MADPIDDPVTEDDLKKRPPLQDNLGMGPVKVASPMGAPSLVPPIGRPVSATGVPMYSPGENVPATGTAPPVNPHVAEAQRMEQSGSGVSQVQAKHPFWGGVLRGLDVASAIAAPAISAQIPGTTMHNQKLIGQQEGLANQDIAQQEKQAQTQDVQSQIPLRQAQTKDAEAQTEERLHPKPQLQMTDEGLVRVPQEGEATPVTIAGSGDTLMKPSAPDKPENAQLQAENAWLSRPENKGKDLADAQKWYTALSPQARSEFHITTPRDRGVIMAVPDGKGGTVLQEIQPGQAVPSGAVTSSQMGGQNVATTKVQQEIEGAKEYANGYVSSGAFTGAGDEALQEQFFTLAKPSTGFRMTQPQIQQLQQSESWIEQAKAKGQHAVHGGWFSDEQRQQIVKTMNDLAAAKEKAHGIGQPQGGGGGGGGIKITRDANGRIIGVE